MREGAPSLLPINLFHFFVLSVSLTLMLPFCLRLPRSLSVRSPRTSCRIIGNFTLRVWRCKGGGGWGKRKKGGGNGLMSATKSFWIGAGAVFHLNWFQRQGSRIRSFGPLAAWLRPATQRQLSFLVPASLCPRIETQVVKSKLFFQKLFCPIGAHRGPTLKRIWHKK